MGLVLDIKMMYTNKIFWMRIGIITLWHLLETAICMLGTINDHPILNTQQYANWNR